MKARAIFDDELFGEVDEQHGDAARPLLLQGSTSCSACWSGSIASAWKYVTDGCDQFDWFQPGSHASRA